MGWVVLHAGWVSLFIYFGSYGRYSSLEGSGRGWDVCSAEHITIGLAFLRGLCSFGYEQALLDPSISPDTWARLARGGMNRTDLSASSNM